MCIFDVAELKAKLHHQSGTTCPVSPAPWSTGNFHPLNKILLRDVLGPGAGGAQPDLAAVVDKKSMRSISGSTSRQNSANVLSYG